MDPIHKVMYKTGPINFFYILTFEIHHLGLKLEWLVNDRWEASHVKKYYLWVLPYTFYIFVCTQVCGNKTSVIKYAIYTAILNMLESTMFRISKRKLLLWFPVSRKTDLNWLSQSQWHYCCTLQLYPDPAHLLFQAEVLLNFFRIVWLA